MVKKKVIKEDYQSDFNKGYQDAINQLKQKLNRGNSNNQEEDDEYIDDITGTIHSAIVDMEDAQREAEVIANQLDDEKDEESKELKQDAKELADKAKEVTKDLKSLGGKGNKHKEIDRDSIDRDIQIKVQKIKDFLGDIKNKTEAHQDDTIARRKVRQEREKQEYDKWFNQRTDLRFLDSLNKLVKNQVARQREYTWRRPSKQVVPGSDVLRRGRAGVENRSIPLIAVFYDRSGSWNTAEKTAVGDQAISMLKENYEKKGLIKIQLYFFADEVSTDLYDENLGGGTSANQLILDTIEQIRATNVIILTDSDMDNTDRYSKTPFNGRVIEVPGGVYFLFKDGRCNKIMQLLKGKTLTEAYDL